MTLDEFLSIKSDADDVAQWAVDNLQYFEASDTDIQQKKQLSSDPDLAHTWASELIEGKNAICGNFAALPVVAARRKGVPAGLIYYKKPDQAIGHEYGWWLRKNGTVGIISAGGKNENGTGSYDCFEEMVSAFKGTRKKGGTVYFQDNTGNHMLDKPSEDSLLAQTSTGILKTLGALPVEKGGSVTEAEHEGFMTTVFKNLTGGSHARR